MTYRIRQSVAALLLATLASHSLFANDSLPGYQQFTFSFPASSERLLLQDADGDGRKDILVIAGNSIQIYFQNTDGFDFSSPDAELTLPGSAIGWDISTNYAPANSNDGAPVFSIVALIDGTRVLYWSVEERRFADPVTLLSQANGFLGQGVFRLNFSRDFNNDGMDDLVIPGAGQLALYIRNSDGSYQQPLTVASDMQLRTVLTPDNPRNLALTGSRTAARMPPELTREVGQSLRIPLMSLRDVNNDGLPDLISDTEERLDVFLASPDSNTAYFPSTPSYHIDRLAIRERLGEFDVDRLDFSNLTGLLALTHEEILQDMNGDGIDDLVLREGGRVALHLGTENGIDLEQADQILRSGGNVLNVFLHDENGNGQPDLWLWRVEQISLGDVFLWLAISGTINIEAFIYPNEGNNFARRPARRITVALRFPSAVRMLGSVREVRERAGNLDAVIPTSRAVVSPEQLSAASASAAMDDLLVLLDDQLDVFYRALAPEPEADEDRFLASINYQRNRDNYEIDIRRMIDEFEIDTNAELDAVAQRTPDVSMPLPGEMQRGDIFATDLNNNGRDDILVFLSRGQETMSGVLWLSNQQ